MNPRAEEIMLSALEMELGAREEFVAQRCGADVLLRAEVEKMLAVADRAEAYLGDFSRRLGVSSTLDDPLMHSPRNLGSYRLVRLLGRGGMGSVYLAERADQQFEKRVALKVLPAGFDDRASVSRFLSERQILARLVHPNIARLLDGGVTDDGTPYFVMDYIDGKPIDAYCERLGLGVKAKLELFRQVCDAVQYAHRNLIVHRDLKPGNVLVDEAGAVKLLDFGVARLLQEAGGVGEPLTEIVGRALTPDYASPEQILGEPLSVTADVYSLGVLLHELLSGQRPYKLKQDSRNTLEQAIRQVQPTKPSDVAPSAVRATLRGDLDTIVHKALQKDTSQRYATVDALWNDVHRWLSGLPIHARPATAWYRLSKYAQRNWKPLSVTASAVLLLSTGVGFVVWQRQQANAERHRADEIRSFISQLLLDADPYGTSVRAPTAGDLLRRAESRISTAFPDRHDLRIELLNLVAGGLTSLQDLDAAEPIAERNLADARQRLGRTHPQTLQARLIRIEILRFRGRNEDMARELRELKEDLRAIDDVPPDVRVSTLLAEMHLAIDEGHYDEALTAARAGQRAAQEKYGDNHRLTAEAAIGVAVATFYGGDAQDALREAETAWQTVTAVFGTDLKHARVVDMSQVLGRALDKAGNHRAAAERLRLTQAAAESQSGRESYEYVVSTVDLAISMLRLGEVAAALQHVESAHSSLAKLAAPDSYAMGSLMRTRGVVLLAARRVDEATKELARSAEILEKTLGAEHERTKSTHILRLLAAGESGGSGDALAQMRSMVEQYGTPRDVPFDEPRVSLGILLRLAGLFPAALEQQYLALKQPVPASNATHLRLAASIEIGLNHLELAEPARAITELNAALEQYSRVYVGAMPLRSDALVGLGRAHLALGDLTAAQRALEEADRFWREFDARNPWAGEAAFWLGRCYQAQHRESDGRAALRRAGELLAVSPLHAHRKLRAMN